MSLCLNPYCSRPQNPENILFCQACGSELLLEGRYRVIRQLGQGGFGKTFEVSHSNTLKVLKILMLDDAKAVSLFQQEARVLSQLNHPGIPKPDGYFTFLPKNSQLPLHCLVMEKIEGLDLQQYLEQRGNRPIDQNLALLWLTQLANILHEVHQQNFFHRDIKPTNIMLKADGYLALIDFGTAREVTATYVQKAAGQKVTGIISLGYTPMEQANGKAVPQSDFFALGRTFVYLLTGKSPDEFPEEPRTGKLMWRDSTLQVSTQIAGLIDYLMEPFPGKRPQNAQTILQCISEINQNQRSSILSASQELLPTLVQHSRNNTQTQSSATNQLKSSNNQKNTLSTKLFQLMYTVIGIIVMILLKFGPREVVKYFSSQASSPQVATSTETEKESAHSKENGNNHQPLISDSNNEQLPISDEKTSEVIPSSWRKFSGGGTELLLPESYQVIDPNQNLHEIVSNLKALGIEGEELAEYLEQKPSAFSIWAFDSNTGDSVIVAKRQVSSTTKLEIYLQRMSKEFPTGIHVVDMKIGFAEGYEVGQIIAEASVLGESGKQLYYFFKDGGTIWYVLFCTNVDEFEQRLPIFEASVRTFSVKP
ncbi:protein kinase [Kalymmatonema gypsitolerans NIES-4073]|nr:protein kinase [Scytonema sp. NIES-4073]